MSAILDKEAMDQFEAMKVYQEKVINMMNKFLEVYGSEHPKNTANNFMLFDILTQLQSFVGYQILEERNKELADQFEAFMATSFDNVFNTFRKEKAKKVWLDK